MDMTVGLVHVTFLSSLLEYAEIENLNFYVCTKTVKSIPDERIEWQLNDKKKKKRKLRNECT
jgi:hypothetical protein